MLTLALAVSCSVAFIPSAAPAPRPAADVVAQVLASQRGYGCCTETLANCLAQKPLCPVAVRQEAAVRRMAAAGMGPEAIGRALAQREQTMNAAGARATSLLDPRFGVGEPTAPVVLVLYACGRSKDCAELVPTLHRAVVGGRLKGKARLFVRPYFPIEGEAASACGRALVAAASQGRFWPFLLTLYNNQENFQRCMLKKWADLEGLDQCAFQAAYDHPDTTTYLEAARREGVQNRIDAVPAAFLDGRRVKGDVSAEALIDLAEEAFEQHPASEAPRAPSSP